jgi:hypothetical protein
MSRRINVRLLLLKAIKRPPEYNLDPTLGWEAEAREKRVQSVPESRPSRARKAPTYFPTLAEMR